MAHPLLWPPKTFFYPVGNTSAVCLTQDLAPEQTADVLLLGCGDPRNILYTVYSDLKLGGKQRKMDITCLDLEPAVLARNILLFSLLASDEPLDLVWNVFYHFMVDNPGYTALKAHSRRLSYASRSKEEWQGSEFGPNYRICSSYTLSQLHQLWTQYAEFDSISQARKKRLEQERTDLCRDVCKKYTNISSISRSAGMLWPQAMEPANQLFQRYWRTGTTFSSQADVAQAQNLNPTFAYSLSGESFVPHYASFPQQAFHTASAYAPILPTKAADCTTAVRSQFGDWASAYRGLMKTGRTALVIRFCVGDVLSFCRALREKQEDPTAASSLYLHQWSSQAMDLDTKDIRTEFDIIDTSNLIDHVGILNILLVACPLLKTLRPSTIYTEALLPMGRDATSSLQDRLCGDITTICLLLSVAPRPLLSAFTSHSNVHELLFNPGGTHQFHERVAWCRPDSGDALSVVYHGLSMTSQDLSKLLFRIYDQILKDERVFDFFRDPMASAHLVRQINHYDRGSFAHLVRHIKSRLVVDEGSWNTAMEMFLDHVRSDRGRMVGMNYFQDLSLQLHLAGVSTESYFGSDWRQDLESHAEVGAQEVFKGWPTVPPIVSVILVVPRDRFKVLWERSDLGSFPLLCRLTSLPMQQENCFASSIQAVPGKLLVGAGSPPRLTIEEEPRGLKIADSLVVSFLAPAWLLTITMTEVSLSVKATPAAAHAFTPILGLDLGIFSASLNDGKHAFVVPNPPSVRSPAPVTFSPAPSQAIDAGHVVRRVQLDDSCSFVTSLTAKLDLRSMQYLDPLPVSTAVTVEQDSTCTMTAVIDSRRCVVSFGYPINGKDRKLRIARKSLYIEIAVPIYDPIKQTDGGYIKRDPFPIIKAPTATTAWNVHNVALDVAPALDCNKSSQLGWVNAQVSLAFSDRETALRKMTSTSHDLSSDMMVSLKDSFHVFFCRILGLAGADGRTQLFGIHSQSVGTFAIIFVNRLCMDLASFSLIADVAVVPLDRDIMPQLSGGLQAVMDSGGLVNIVTTPDEATAWKRLLPACVERCRTWSHGRNCEYAAKDRIPLSVELDETPLCSCGHGISLPKSIPGVSAKAWKLLKPFATRAAISPLFAVSYVEAVATSAKNSVWDDPQPDTRRPGRQNATSQPSLVCRKCQGPGKPKLLQCGKCKSVKYCSKECAISDWKEHKMVCRST